MSRFLHISPVLFSVCVQQLVTTDTLWGSVQFKHLSIIKRGQNKRAFLQIRGLIINHISGSPLCFCLIRFPLLMRCEKLAVTTGTWNQLLIHVLAREPVHLTPTLPLPKQTNKKKKTWHAARRLRLILLQFCFFCCWSSWFHTHAAVLSVNQRFGSA